MELVRRGLVASREQARLAVEAGRVVVAGVVADKTARLVGASEALLLTGDPPRFVGRGGEKLVGALQSFGVDVAGHTCVDVGSSTGGFTDCLLQFGAAQVVAVDVGYGQLHERLRADPRVVSHERLHVRDAPALLGCRFTRIVADLSFISLITVAGAISELATSEAIALLLVKPQFEAGREVVSRGRGVVRDPDVWTRAIYDVAVAFAGRGAAMMGCMRSPITGADGNVEFLLHLAWGRPHLSDAANCAMVAAAMDVDVPCIGADTETSAGGAQ